MPKMSREERAKQFMPFAALKGYPEALARREKKPLPRRELSEESLEELNRRLRQLTPGDWVEVLYYIQGEYRTFSGAFSGVDNAMGKIRIGEMAIPLQNIYDLRPASVDSHL